MIVYTSGGLFNYNYRHSCHSLSTDSAELADTSTKPADGGGTAPYKVFIMGK